MFEFAESSIFRPILLTTSPHTVTISIIQHSCAGLSALDGFQVLDRTISSLGSALRAVASCGKAGLGPGMRRLVLKNRPLRTRTVNTIFSCLLYSLHRRAQKVLRHLYRTLSIEAEEKWRCSQCPITLVLGNAWTNLDTHVLRLRNPTELR